MGKLIRCISEDGTLTGLVDAAETLGIQSKGVYVYNKHFVLNCLLYTSDAADEL